MPNYLYIKDRLETAECVMMAASGNSMTPLIKSGSKLILRKTNDYQVGDVVFCKVKGNFYIHKITKKSNDKYLISNNKGHDNGWTDKVFGRVVSVNNKPFGRKE